MFVYFDVEIKLRHIFRPSRCPPPAFPAATSLESMRHIQKDFMEVPERLEVPTASPKCIGRVPARPASPSQLPRSGGPVRYYYFYYYYYYYYYYHYYHYFFYFYYYYYYYFYYFYYFYYY